MRRKKNKRLHEYLPSLQAGFSGKPGHKWSLYKRFKSFIHSPSKICVRKKGWFSHITKKARKKICYYSLGISCSVQNLSVVFCRILVAQMLCPHLLTCNQSHNLCQELLSDKTMYPLHFCLRYYTNKTICLYVSLIGRLQESLAANLNCRMGNCMCVGLLFYYPPCSQN